MSTAESPPRPATGSTTPAGEASRTWTITLLLRWCTSWFANRGLDAPRLDAELLLAHALKLRRIDLFMDPGRPLHEDELARFKALIRRRAAREPLAYILGRRDFWKATFQVTPGVLIPRPDSERLVEATLETIPDREQPLTLLDIGVGSGCLLLSLLQELPQARGVGVDIAPEPLACTQANAQALGLADRIHLVQGDRLQWLAPRLHFERVIANPPYIPRDDLATLEPEVNHWEPRTALDGGPDGLNLYRELLPAMAGHLAPGGCLLLEIGADQAGAVTALARQTGLTDITVLQDYGQRDRVVQGRK